MPGMDKIFSHYPRHMEMLMWMKYIFFPFYMVASFNINRKSNYDIFIVWDGKNLK